MLLFSLLANQERTHTLFLAFNIGREAKKAATMTIRPAGVEAAMYVYELAISERKAAHGFCPCNHNMAEMSNFS